MIAAHDSYTYLEPEISIFKKVSFLWRTQDKTLIEQYNNGVRYFDIRIRRINKDAPSKNKWQVCHGLVDLATQFLDIQEILDTVLVIGNNDAVTRLILESGTEEDEEEFSADVRNLLNNYQRFYDVLDYCCIKSGWKVIYNTNRNFVDYSFVPYNSGDSFLKNIKNALKHPWRVINTIKNWRNKHTPSITTEMILDKNTVYFYDFI